MNLTRSTKEWKNILSKIMNLLKRNKNENFIAKTLLGNWNKEDIDEILFVAKVSIKTEKARKRQCADYRS